MLLLQDVSEQERLGAPVSLNTKIKQALLAFFYAFISINGFYRTSFCAEQLGYVNGWISDSEKMIASIEFDPN